MSNNAIPTIKDEAELSAEEIKPLTRIEVMREPLVYFWGLAQGIAKNPVGFMLPMLKLVLKVYAVFLFIHALQSFPWGSALHSLTNGSDGAAQPDTENPPGFGSEVMAEYVHGLADYGQKTALDFVHDLDNLLIGVTIKLPLFMVGLAALRPGLNIHAAPRENIEAIASAVEKKNSKFIAFEDNNHSDARIPKLVAGMMGDLKTMGVSDFIVEAAMSDSVKLNDQLGDFFKGKISAVEIRERMGVRMADLMISARANGIRLWVVDPRGDNPKTPGSIQNDFVGDLRAIDKEIARRANVIAEQARGRVGILYGGMHFARGGGKRGIDAYLGNDKVTRVSVLPGLVSAVSGLFAWKSEADFTLNYRNGAVHADEPTMAVAEDPLRFSIFGGFAGRVIEAARPRAGP